MRSHPCPAGAESNTAPGGGRAPRLGREPARTSSICRRHTARTRSSTSRPSAAYITSPMQGLKTLVYVDQTRGLKPPLYVDQTRGLKTPLYADQTRGLKTPLYADQTRGLKTPLYEEPHTRRGRDYD